MTVKEVLKECNYKAGYVVRTEVHDGWGGSDLIMRSAYNPDGVYIGASVDAYQKARHFGIRKFEKADPEHNVCSIGFDPEKEIWYGWSHRAMYGFGIGSTVKKGDCAYVPVDEEDFLEDCVRFWHDEEYNVKTWGEHGTEERTECRYAETPNGQIVEVEGSQKTKTEEGVWVYSLYNDKVPNEKLCGTTKSHFAPYPKFGRGEWTATTLDEAKEMAIAFADGVS